MEINTGARRVRDANSFRDKVSEFILSMNGFIKDRCDDLLVPYVNLYSDFGSPDREDLLDPALAIGDNAHLNMEGQKRLARCFHEGYLKDADGATTIVCLGDSHTQGFPVREPSRNGLPVDLAVDDPHQYPYWLKEWTGKILINRGIAGNTIYGLKKRFDKEVLPHLPDHCFIQGGTNDSLLGTPLEESEKDMEDLIERCLSAEIIPVVGTIIPLGF